MASSGRHEEYLLSIGIVDVLDERYGKNTLY